MTQNEVDPRKTEDCRRACHHCSLACLQAIRFLLNDTNEHVDHHLLLSLQVCADLCALNAKTLALGSDLHEHTCGATAGVARACAIELDRLKQNEILRNCAETCRQCAENCEEMIKTNPPLRPYEKAAHVPH